MAYLVSDCINEARGILQDRDTTTDYRYSDADMVDYANSALGAIALHRPDLFSTIGTIPVTAATTIQSAPAGSLRIMEVFRINAGRVVKECLHDDLDMYNVNWHNDAAGPTVNWIRHPRDPNKFFVYPQVDAATAIVGLFGQWAASPAIVTAASAIPIPDAYKPVIVEYLVWRAESRDDEYVSSPRAVLFLEAFKASLGVSARTKATADADKPTQANQQQQPIGAPNPGASQAQAIAAPGNF